MNPRGMARRNRHALQDLKKASEILPTNRKIAWRHSFHFINIKYNVFFARLSAFALARAGKALARAGKALARTGRRWHALACAGWRKAQDGSLPQRKKHVASRRAVRRKG